MERPQTGSNKLYLLCRNSVHISHPERMVGRVGWTGFSQATPQVCGEASKCPACGGFTSWIPWLPPFFAELEFETAEAGDIAFGPGGGMVVSKRFLTAWQKSGLVGLSGFEPVTIKKVKRFVKRQPRVVPEYCCVKIANSKAVVDIAKSGLILKAPPSCPVCLSPNGVIRTARICLQEDLPPQEDIFYPKILSGRILVTQRFVDWANQNEFFNVIVVPAEEAAFDHYFGIDIETLRARWAKEARLKEIASRLTWDK